MMDYLEFYLGKEDLLVIEQIIETLKQSGVVNARKIIYEYDIANRFTHSNNRDVEYWVDRIMEGGGV